MELQNVVPWGRSFEEYCAIFNLTEEDLQRSILGVGDGPASFNAELTRRGGKVVSVDPTYQFSADALQTRIAEVYDEIMPKMQANQDQFIWENIPSVEALGAIRMRAMTAFIEDYETGKSEGRYIEGALPELGFHDHQFDLALCSHFLFLYSAHVSLAQHIASLKSLCRVAREVRIYPLLTLDNQRSPHLDDVMATLHEAGLGCSLVPVGYQFQKGAKQMLVVKSQPS